MKNIIFLIRCKSLILGLVFVDENDRILPWKVVDAFDKGLFEGVAPYVVDDEVGGGVDDEAEVVHAGQAQLPGCWT